MSLTTRNSAFPVLALELDLVVEPALAADFADFVVLEAEFAAEVLVVELEVVELAVVVSEVEFAVVSAD